MQDLEKKLDNLCDEFLKVYEKLKIGEKVEKVAELPEFRTLFKVLLTCKIMQLWTHYIICVVLMFFIILFNSLVVGAAILLSTPILSYISCKSSLKP